MASRRFGLAAIVSGLCLLCGCSSRSPEGLTIRQAGTLTVDEGLPHQMYEANSFQAEKKTKPTIELHGFPFYHETLALNAGDQEKLKVILGDSHSYQPDSGEKKCGGFHPDYAVGWSVDGEPYVCLICFGCGEFRVYGPAGEASYDMLDETRKRLHGLLAPYRRDRPLHASFGLWNPA